MVLLLLWRELGRSTWVVCFGSIGLQFSVAHPCLHFFSTSLDPVCAARVWKKVHRRGGWNGIIGALGDYPHCDIRKAGASRHPAAVGGGVPVPVHRCG